MRITNNGGFVYCRWADQNTAINNLQDISPTDFFQKTLAPIRQSMLDGNVVSGCDRCVKMETHKKISGRQKQLLKTGIQLEEFTKTLASSPWVSEFNNSYHDGTTKLLPQDWQIDLGNYCNSACVFCGPGSSSKLAAEFQKLKLINQLPPPAWCNNPVVLQKFIDSLTQSPHLQYLHFIGGETLITPAFKTILEALVAAELHHTVTIGFTTNLTVWDDSLIKLLCKFNKVNLGVSIECFHPVNDYVRWPSHLSKVTACLYNWLEIATQQEWYVQIRTTPTMLTVHQLLSVYDFAWQHEIAVESCNFLVNPEYMKPSVLPPIYRKQIVSEMKQWLLTHSSNGPVILNIRSPEFIKNQICQDLSSYINYLETEPDESHLLPALVDYLKLLESGRGNSILDYLPKYEELFRTAGY
jgi:sulfatase maturation enzyme AslB (radical SAM superfamily)